MVRHAPYRLLQSSEAPNRRSKSIGMDFITNLPKSAGYDTILVVIHQLTTMSHFIPCAKDLDPRQFADLFMKEIVRLHRLPHDSITNRVTLFTSDLWKETMGKLGIERRLSTAFHPQTEGADRTNQCHIGTIPGSIHQESKRPLVWVPTTCRLCVQQRILEDNQKHTLLCKLRNQPRIRDDWSSDSRKAKETRRNDSVT